MIFTRSSAAEDLILMPYDNRQYWTRLHETFKGQLKAVGHPYLSESLNQLKYSSEGAAIEQVLQEIIRAFQKKGQQAISFLDIGAGTGYWTDLISSLFLSHKCQIEVSALDISSDALAVVKERLPFVHVIREDLRMISPDKFSNSYDLVSACYCFHHLVKTSDFINALRFAGSSVRRDGYLLIMDPVLTRRFSNFDTIDYYSFRGNGIPRHLYFIDDILFEIGLRRYAVSPAISFILNGNIEASGFLSYFVMNGMWEVLCRLYRSERLTRSLSGVLMPLDRLLKRMNFSFSSSVCVYRREL